MNAAKDRRSPSILAYLEGSDRSAHIARTRFNENLTITVSADMKNAVERFAQKHRINRSEAVRALITEALPRLDSELDRKAKHLGRRASS